MRPNRGVGLGARAKFVFIRRLERILSPRGLRRLLVLIVAARTAFRHHRPSQPLPGCLGGGEFRTCKKQQRNHSLNLLLENLPERLGTPKWRDRLQFDGLQFLETARRQKRPVILAFCHFGPYSLLRFWLRAAGFPAATLVKGDSKERSAIRRLRDRFAPLPEVPLAFHRDDQLRDAVEFLAAGNVLLTAVDIMSGRKMELPVDESWRFWMATGPIRMAIRHAAELIPCSIIDQGDWHFQIRLGPPVPASLLASNDPFPAGKYLLDALLPTWREHPEHCTKDFLGKFHRADAADPAISQNELSTSSHCGIKSGNARPSETTTQFSFSTEERE